MAENDVEAEDAVIGCGGVVVSVVLRRRCAHLRNDNDGGGGGGGAAVCVCVWCLE
jgi:hypothetical protein